MCILVVALHCHPRFPFICAHNRDERLENEGLRDLHENYGGLWINTSKNYIYLLGG